MEPTISRTLSIKLRYSRLNGVKQRSDFVSVVFSSATTSRSMRMPNLTPKKRF